MNLKLFITFIFCIVMTNSIAQITSVGSGSYTNQFPGVDAANRNGYPSGSPQLTGTAIGKPVPTNDWWSSLIKENHVSNLFNYPMTLKTTNEGLVMTYIPWGVIGDLESIVVGIEGLNSSQAKVSDYSDWTVTVDWQYSSHQLSATTGIGMPFVYFEKQSSNLAKIEVLYGNVTVSNEKLIITDSRYNSDYVVYAPVGSTWNQSGNTYTSSLNNKNYWSVVMLPQSNTNATQLAQEYQKYAYVFPNDTQVSWAYNEVSSSVRTNFTIDTDVKEGTNDKILQGLLPHQWANLANDSATPNKETYSSIRGDLKMMEGNSFAVENSFKGVLPTLPYLANYSASFLPGELSEKIDLIKNNELATWTDSYNEGQVMNRLVQTARIADQMGDIEARDIMLATVKERLEDWLTYENSEVAFLFYYNSNWSTLFGYPAGHGQDTNINDHHFHWGYFIHAASFIEQFEPGWADQWGEMINHLVRDAASPNRDDSKFPFLRNFSPYAGHCWANGFASFPQGNDQESTSESMQFNTSLIHWGTITGNDEIRDLGIYLYTTEQTAVEEYWFDQNERTLSSTHPYSLVSRIWGNSYDNGTFWTSDIAASYGIEMYPIHGGSLYLGHNTSYAQNLWTEIESNTGILSNEVNPNLWHDVMWQYLSFIDPQKAINLYNSYPERSLKFGISDAQTYHWLHSMNALGTVDTGITADYPIAAVFMNSGEKIYVAHNYGSSPIVVTFSDGYELDAPANQMTTSKDVEVTGHLSSDFNLAFHGGSVNLSVLTTGSGVTKVEFYDGATLISEDNTPPYEAVASNLSLGFHNMYAKVYMGSDFTPTNIIDVRVGEQLPYNTPLAIPGVIEAGHYDRYEGGVGQGVSYYDSSVINEGDFRTSEYVDASNDSEGANVGWISAGEWLEYTIDVAQSGYYTVNLRYASGNTNGGGPFYFEIDGQQISQSVPLNYTGDWGNWQNKLVSNIPLTQGEHVLRVAFTQGEFNLGRMTFSYSGALNYVPPIADAGENRTVVSPSTTTTLDGSNSTYEAGKTLTYQWEQIYGPSIIGFSDSTSATPEINNLITGMYKIKLSISDGTYSAHDVVFVNVSSTENVSPTVFISSPADGESFGENANFIITASADDFDGSIALVEFYEGSTKIGEDSSEPFQLTWSASGGNYELTAKAIDNEGASTVSSAVAISVYQQLPYLDTAFTIPGTIEAGHFDKFQGGLGQNISYYDTSTTNQGGFRPTEYVDAVDDHEGANVGWIEAGEWMEYTINVVQSGYYEVDMRFASGTATGGGPFYFEIDGNQISDGITFTPTGGWDSWSNKTATIPLNQGEHVLRVAITQGGFNLGRMTFSYTSALSMADTQLNEIQIYPNPTTGILSITPHNEWIEVSVYDLQGRELMYLEEVREQINLSDIKNGIYFMSIGQGSQKRTFKIIKK